MFFAFDNLTLIRTLVALLFAQTSWRVRQPALEMLKLCQMCQIIGSHGYSEFMLEPLECKCLQHV